MVRVNISLSDEDLERFREQAKREGMSLSAWLRAAAKNRVAKNGGSGSTLAWEPPEEERFRSVEELRAFFRRVDERHGPNPEPEPDWVETKRLIEESKLRGLP